METETNRIVRRSPIVFNAAPIEKRRHNGFDVVMAYDNESDKNDDAPAIIDLSHMAKWDIQDAHLDQIKPLDHTLPEMPGACLQTTDNLFMFRLNTTQAGIWHICNDNPSTRTPGKILEGPAYTDITDARALIAVVGRGVPSLIEKITDLDLMSPSLKPPFLLQGPILRIAGRILVACLGDDHALVFFSFPRGYGQTMAEALLEAGSRQGVYFAGERLLWDRL